jgi:hypothetical protein
VIGLASAFAPTLTPNAAMRYRLYDARGYDVPVDFRFGTFWNANVRPVLPGTPIQGPTTVAERTLRGLSLLSVADILQSPAEKQIEMPGLRVAYDGPDARIYANDRALPRAFVVHRQTVVDGGASALAAVSAAGFDGRSSVVTEDRLPGLAVGGVAPPPAGERASIVGDAGDRIVLDAVARRPGMLVLTDTFDSGWEASVDGRSAPIHRVDYMLRGVPIGAGKHRVELRYRPTSYTVGLALSGLTAVALAGAVILAWRRRT